MGGSPRVCTRVQHFCTSRSIRSHEHPHTHRQAPRRAPSASSAAAVAVETVRPDRRQAILLAAEKLFAQHGYHAVTIRQIAEEAGVPLGAGGLLPRPEARAVPRHLRALEPPPSRQRLAGLAAVNLDPDDARTLPRIIEAFTTPVLALRASPEGEYYALLVARELSNATEEADRVLRAYFDPLAEAFIDALQVVLPHATRGEVAWGYQFALGALLNHLNSSRIERACRAARTRPAIRPWRRCS